MAPAPPCPRLSCLNFGLSSTRPARPESTTSSPPSAPALPSVSPGSSPRAGDQEPPALRCGREALAGGEEKLGGVPGPEGRGAGAQRREHPAPLPRLLLQSPPLPVPCKQQPELPSARAAEMSSSSPPAGAASAAISASEKVDGFTRKSVRKAQRQKRSQGSSQFRSQGSQAELHPLPQLKGNLRGRSPGSERRGWQRLPLRKQSHFLLGFSQLGLLVCEPSSPRCLGVPSPPPPYSNGFSVKSWLFPSNSHLNSFHPRGGQHPSPPARLLNLHFLFCVPRGRALHSFSRFALSRSCFNSHTNLPRPSVSRVFGHF